MRRIVLLALAALTLIAPALPAYSDSITGTVVCAGNGTSGKRISVFYVYPTGTPNDSLTRTQALRQGIGHIDEQWLAQSGGAQHPRWVCDPLTQFPDVTVFQAPAIGTDNTITFDEIRNAMIAAGKTSANRIYLMAVDNISCCYLLGGQATIDHDDRAGQDNPNNTGPAYAMVDADQLNWNIASLLGRGLWHELGHTLGAVQCTAPHSTCPAGELGHHHCYDEKDIMCRNDGGSYFDQGGQLQQVCAIEQWDCNKNDYYSVNPAPGSYLDTHWNLANSDFVAPN